MVKTMKNKKALAGVLLSLSLAGGIVAPASVAFATDETPAAETVAEAPVAEAPAPTAEVITEAPVTEAPAPAAEPVVAEAPAPVTAEIPATEPVVTEAPVVETPAMEAPVAAPTVVEAPVAEVVTEAPATAPTTEASTSEARSFYVHIYQNEKLLLEGIRPLQVKLGDDPIAFVRSQTFNEEYGLFLRGEVEYLNEGAGIVKLYFSTTVTTTEEPKVTTTEEPKVTTTEEPKVTTTEEPKVTTTEEPKVTTTTEEPKTTIVVTPPSNGGKGGGSATAEPKKVLPNTGETNSVLTVVGMVLLGFVGLIGATYKHKE